MAKTNQSLIKKIIAKSRAKARAEVRASAKALENRERERQRQRKAREKLQVAREQTQAAEVRLAERMRKEAVEEQVAWVARDVMRVNKVLEAPENLRRIRDRGWALRQKNQLSKR